jgi:cytochrome c oxidase cbb3-type subunit 2
MFVQGVLPSLIPESRSRAVTRAVRTDTGEVVWVPGEATDYTAVEARGRRVYIREGCWYCHSQYVRPVAGEEMRWGPLSQAGEYAFDLPHLMSTRRVGPDLTRVGLKYSDDWHYAHHWNPRLTAPDSIMPRVPWLFEQLDAAYAQDAAGLRLTPTAALRRYFTLRADRPIPLYPSDAGLAFVRPPPHGTFPIDGTPVLDGPSVKGAGGFSGAPTIRLVVPTPDMIALVRYLQKLGTNRGIWRDAFAPQQVGVSVMTIPRTNDLPERGRRLYERRCAGCHGARGDGNGPAATFLDPRPRDFTAGVFKFRSTPSGSLPTDGDLFQTVTRGVRWTAMPPWHELGEKDRLAVVTYVKTFSDRFSAEAAEAVALPRPPPATAELRERGRALYTRAKCFECHGERGAGDGPSAGQLKDDFDLPIRPTDFTRGQLKGGSSATDVFRTTTLGLDGTPMPSFGDALSDDERWAVSYYVLSLSAWTDPLTGAKLPR